MGRVNDDLLQANKAPTMKHFSHPHELELSNLQNPVTILCSACKLHSSGTIYICRPCNFVLHSSCSQFPQLITHPCHPNHALSLLPVSLYPGGKFNCDACNNQGNGFSYHCNVCEFDLHVMCASKPLKITHQLHSCQLELTFKSPYHNTNSFSCDVCSKMGSKQWLYRCSRCEFDVHLDCANATAIPRSRTQSQALVQHPNSFPGPNLSNQFQAPIGATQTVQNQMFQPPMATGQVYGSIRPSVSMGSVSNYPKPQLFQNNQASRTDSLANAAMQGLVEGAAQTVGQTLMQSIVGSGDGGGDCSVVLGNIYVESDEENL